MQNFTHIIGAKVISAHNCEYLGTVINMQMNAQHTQMRYLTLSGADDETLFILPIHRILSANDIVLVRNKTALSVTAETEMPSLINCQAVSLNGENYGQITDLLLNENFKILKIITNTQEIEPSKLINFANGIALINNTDKKYTNATFAPHVKIPEIAYETTNLVNTLAQDESNFVATPRTIIARLPKNFKTPK